jgi:DNA primase
LYDGDEAGIKASLRGIDMLLEGGLNVKAVVFPEGEDPDSYSRKTGTQAFQNYLRKTKGISSNLKLIYFPTRLPMIP